MAEYKMTKEEIKAGITLYNNKLTVYGYIQTQLIDKDANPFNTDLLDFSVTANEVFIIDPNSNKIKLLKAKELIMLYDESKKLKTLTYTENIMEQINTSKSIISQAYKGFSIIDYIGKKALSKSSAKLQTLFAEMREYNKLLVDYLVELKKGVSGNIEDYLDIYFFKKEINMKKVVKELKNFLLNREYAFTIHLEDTPCDNYVKWKDSWVDPVKGTMKIYTGGSNHTIYDEDSMGATLNILARAWHDEYHYIADLDFSYEGEMRVQELQWNELKRAKLSEEAQLLFLLDMVGQTTFYQKSKKNLYKQNYIVNMWYSMYLNKYDATVSSLPFETIKQRIKDIV